MEPLQQEVSILAVEDDIVTRELIGIMVARRFPGITLYFAENGRIALEIFKEHLPDIVVTDINMPEMDGITMAGLMKPIKADTRFIVVTAYGTTSYFEKFGKIGFHAFLSKPLEFAKLFNAIEKCIAEIKQGRVTGGGRG